MQIRTKTTRWMGMAVLLAASAALAENSVHVGIHRHLHQPIYWGEPVPSRPDQSQFGRDSQDLKDAGQAFYGDTIQHPENQLIGGNNSVFENPDKQQAYQNNIKNSVGAMSPSDSGMTISFSGALQRNLWSFGRGSSNGYSPGWNNNNITAYNWTTSGGNSRAEVLGQTYNHAFSPLLPKSVLRKQIEMHRERTAKSWGAGADQSKGFWPIELAFSRHMIPILLEYNYEWVMVANSHIARTCPNYMDALAQPSPGAELKADPPNRADQLGPTVPLNQWYGANRDTFGNVFPTPFAYQAHRAQYIDPDTGTQQTIIAVPQCDYHGYQSGFGAVGWSFIDDKISTYNDPNQPSLVMLTNDGENFWGGGNSFWNEFAPGFMNDAAGHGKKATTIQQFLDNHSVPANDIIHVEDGSWLAADQGSPQFYRWLEPPRPIDPNARTNSDPNTFFDLEDGWHSDMRNWAVMLAGVNYCETAEQITGSGNVLAWRIEEPYQDDGTYNNPNTAEKAWHFLMWGFDSGFVYFGDSLDDEVKHTFAANRAISIAAPVVGDTSLDTTPPTVFKPQRFPWNPGGKGKGQYLGGLTTGGGTVGFSTAPWPSDFYIWTMAFDVSGLSNVTLKVRSDADGMNPLNDTANETYAGGAGVGNWVSIPMTVRAMPKDDPTNSGGLNFFVLPDYISDYCWAKVEGYRDELLDYYIEAVDNKGHVHKSEIQHVYVEDDGTAPTAVRFSEDPRDCAPLTVTYDSTSRPLAAENPVFVQISFDEGTNWNRFGMSDQGTGVWSYAATVPNNAPTAAVWFENTAGTVVDSNDGANWSIGIRDCEAPTGPSLVTFDPAAPTNCGPVTITYRPNAGPLAGADPIYIHVGRNGPTPWEDIVTPDPAMTNNGNGSWSYTYSPPPNTDRINCVFNNGALTWDSNNNADWFVLVADCLGPYDPEICAAPGSPLISDPPLTNQNHAGDVFDLDPLGGSATTSGQSGFGSFGQVYINYDATNLYVGAHGADMSGDNNAMMLFLDVDTLSDDKQNLWSNSGDPRGLDNLHNVEFVTPMDIAILLGSETGDVTDASGTISSGFALGQGVFYLSASNFNPVAGARISQFDGVDFFPTSSADDDGDARTDRWEVAIPWGSLNAADINGLSSMVVAGLIASESETGPDRYLSSNYLGESATGTLDGFNNFGFNFVQLTGHPVCLPHLDDDGDGLDNGYELRYWQNAGIGEPDDNIDGDAFSNLEEQVLGTDPTDGASTFILFDLAAGAAQNLITWTSVGGRSYAVEYTDALGVVAFAEIAQVTETDVAVGVETSEAFVDDFALTGGAPANGQRTYRVRFVPAP